MIFGNNADLNGNQLLNFRIQLIAGSPGSPVEAQMWYDSTAKAMKYRDDTGTRTFGTSGGSVSSVGLAAPATIFAVSNSPVTGTGTLTLAYATGQTANRVVGTDGFGNVGLVALTSSHLPSSITITGTLSSAGLTSTGTVDLSGASSVLVPTPTLAGQAAPKSYVDLLAQGMPDKHTANYATTGALPANTYANGTAGVGATLTGNANGALTSQDGQTITAGDLIFVKNEATTARNGLYVVTQVGDGTHPYILTRHTDMDVSAEFGGAVIAVENGPTNGGSLWMCTTNNPTVGTTALTFVELNKAADLSPGTGITITANTVALTAAYAGNGIGTVNGIAKGNGSGTITAAAAADLTALGGALSFLGTITGDGVTTAFNIDHNLNESFPGITIRDSSGNEVIVDNQATTANRVVVTFAVAPANAVVYKVKVVK